MFGWQYHLPVSRSVLFLWVGISDIAILCCYEVDNFELLIVCGSILISCKQMTAYFHGESQSHPPDVVLCVFFHNFFMCGRFGVGIIRASARIFKIA